MFGRRLSVANLPQRADDMIAAVNNMTAGRGSGIFLFTDTGALSGADILTRL
jgi:hypothetical protein